MDRRFRVPVSLLAVPLMLLVGCSSEPGAPGNAAFTAPTADLEQEARPGSTSGSGWYPLTLGGMWRYDRQVTTQVTPEGGEPGTPVVDASVVNHDLIITEELLGRTYVVELQRTEAEGQTPVLLFARYRQDRLGLYQADVPLDDPPGDAVAAVSPDNSRGWTRVAATVRDDSRLDAYQRAYDQISARRSLLQAYLAGTLETLGKPGGGGSGVQPGEIQLLKYGLKPGISWAVRMSPLVTASCEAREVLALPAGSKRGYRVRVDSELFGPEDAVYLWYSSEGLLKFTAHFEGQAVDDQGNVIGTVVSDESKVLTMVKLGTQG